MKYESIADIYSANERFREHFLEIVRDISPDEAVKVPDGDKWNIQQIVEHVGIVNAGMSRICAKLLAAAVAEGNLSDGGFSMSERFSKGISMMGERKAEAPERVLPTGTVSITATLDTFPHLDAEFRSYRIDLERFDVTAHTFPHPYFGPLNAAEWLVMQGLHEGRHAKQIEKMLGKIRR